MVKTFNLNISLLQSLMTFVMALAYGWIIYMTFQNKTHVYIMVGFPILWISTVYLKKITESETVKKTILKLKIAMVITVIIVVSTLILSGSPKQTAEPKPASYFEQSE